jgi:hypothetical protein
MCRYQYISTQTYPQAHTWIKSSENARAEAERRANEVAQSLLAIEECKIQGKKKKVSMVCVCIQNINIEVALSLLAIEEHKIQGKKNKSEHVCVYVYKLKTNVYTYVFI